MNATSHSFIYFDRHSYFIVIAILVNSNESTTECMRNLLNSSQVHEILSEAISDGGEAVADRYLHDFAHMTYTPQGDDELEVTVDHLPIRR